MQRQSRGPSAARLGTGPLGPHDTLNPAAAVLWRPPVTEWSQVQGCPIGQDWAQWVAWCKFSQRP